jgi:hypothetical protein
MNQPNQQDPQVIVTCRIAPNSTGGEVLKFNVNLGFFQLKVIATIPCEGETEAPVYIKWRIRQESEKTDRKTDVVKFSKNRRERVGFTETIKRVVGA